MLPRQHVCVSFLYFILALLSTCFVISSFRWPVPANSCYYREEQNGKSVKTNQIVGLHWINTALIAGVVLLLLARCLDHIITADKSLQCQHELYETETDVTYWVLVCDAILAMSSMVVHSIILGRVDHRIDCIIDLLMIPAFCWSIPGLLLCAICSASVGIGILAMVSIGTWSILRTCFLAAMHTSFPMEASFC